MIEQPSGASTPAPAPAVVLRPVSAADERFLFALYASTRQEELDAWGWDEPARATFLKLQFNAQQTGYRTQFPQATFQLVLLDGHPAGWLVVNRAPAELRLVDIALLPAHRGGGVGTGLIQRLLAEATEAHLPVRLRVLRGQRARQLYERLGFFQTGEHGAHVEMEWSGAGGSKGSDATDPLPP